MSRYKRHSRHVTSDNHVTVAFEPRALATLHGDHPTARPLIYLKTEPSLAGRASPPNERLHERLHDAEHTFAFLADSKYSDAYTRQPRPVDRQPLAVDIECL